VFQVEIVLNGSGLLKRAPGTRFGDDTASAIGQGQARLNQDHSSVIGRTPLKIDRLINPEGPTHTASRGLARHVADQWHGFEQRRESALPKPGLPNPQHPSVTPVADHSLNIDITRLQDAMSADQAGELTRLADGLAKTRTPGAVARDISDAINTDGLKAVAEFKFIRDRLAKIGSPEQVRALDEAVLGQLSEKTQEQLKGVFSPDPAVSREKAIPLELNIDPALESETLSMSANQKPSPTSASKDNADQSGETNHTDETDFRKINNMTPEASKKARQEAADRITKIDERKRLADINASLQDDPDRPVKGVKGESDNGGKGGEERAKSETKTTLRGTTFFGGAGMEGAYIADMVKALKEAGVLNVRSAESKKWSGGHISDALDVLNKRKRDEQDSDLSAMRKEGEQFNLIGYSYGGLQASQAAIDYADEGGKVDHLVLLGTPISREFLDKLKNHPNIGRVEVINLEKQGDPIKAGMTTGALLGSLPKLGLDVSSGGDGGKKGHFYYGGDSAEGRQRRRELANRLYSMGLK